MAATPVAWLAPIAVIGIIVAASLAGATGYLLLTPAGAACTPCGVCTGPWYPGSNPGGPGETPLGTAIALGAPMVSTVGGQHWYNMSVEGSGSGLTWGATFFSVRSSFGAEIPATDGWSATIVESQVGAVAQFAFLPGPGSWSSGGDRLVTTNQTIALDSGATNLTAQGNLFELVGTGGCFAGSVAVAIP